MAPSTRFESQSGCGSCGIHYMMRQDVRRKFVKYPPLGTRYVQLMDPGARGVSMERNDADVLVNRAVYCCWIITSGAALTAVSRAHAESLARGDQ